MAYSVRATGHPAVQHPHDGGDGGHPVRVERACQNAAMAYDQDIVNRVREHVGHEHGLTEKRMFGGHAFLINGHLAVSASSKGGLMVRVDPAESQTLLRQPHAEPFEMRGREMTGWLHLRVDSDMDDGELGRWVERGVGYAQSLPPK